MGNGAVKFFLFFLIFGAGVVFRGGQWTGVQKIKSGQHREGSGWSRCRPGDGYVRPWYRRFIV